MQIYQIAAKDSTIARDGKAAEHHWLLVFKGMRLCNPVPDGTLMVSTVPAQQAQLDQHNGFAA